ncbi:MAG: SHOCT-like domain-containing protein [Bacillota bacterium]|jgi:hypothetical protein
MDERLIILEMVRDGKVSPEQAVELLGAVEGGKESIVDNFVSIHADRESPRLLRITSTSGKGATTFDLPLGVIKFFNSLLPGAFKVHVNKRKLNREELMDLIYSGRRGVIYREETEGGEVVIELV